jgi:hypothetical protein
LIGGFELGATNILPLKNHKNLKTNATIARQVYWEEPLGFTDLNGIGQGTVKYSKADLKLNISSVYHLPITKKFSAGLGLGLQTQLISGMRFKQFIGSDLQKSQILLSNPFKRLMPTIPAEITWQNPKAIYTIRYEQALLNKYKAGLGSYFKYFYGVAVAEVGIKL